jgi:hypothetical protein
MEISRKTRWHGSGDPSSTQVQVNGLEVGRGVAEGIHPRLRVIVGVRVSVGNGEGERIAVGVSNARLEKFGVLASGAGPAFPRRNGSVQPARRRKQLAWRMRLPRFIEIQ